MKRKGFQVLGFLVAGCLLGSPLGFSKVSGWSRLNPASEDSSLLYTPAEMAEMREAKAEKDTTFEEQKEAAASPAPTPATTQQVS